MVFKMFYEILVQIARLFIYELPGHFRRIVKNKINSASHQRVTDRQGEINDRAI